MSKQLQLWFDMETTGDSEQDVPIEVGAVITDERLEQVGDPFTSIVHIPVGFNMRWVVEAVQEMHGSNGLWTEVFQSMRDYREILEKTYPDESAEFYASVEQDAPRSCSSVDLTMHEWILRTTNEYDISTQGKVLDTLNVRLAGSGVSHFDSRFIKKWFPFTWGLIEGYSNDTKPTADLGVLRRLLNTFGLPELVAPTEFDILPDLKPHRALDDVSLFIQQAKWYRQTLRKISACYDEHAKDREQESRDW